MRVLNKDEFKLEKENIFEEIKNGAMFIYPTDTIYGIGCNALDYKSVKMVREAKERYTRPFSVIAPSKEWIRENCVVDKKKEQWIEKLPGPYTLILKLKDKDVIAPNVNSDMDTLGVRIPKHWFTQELKKLGIPIVTTSANIIGEAFMTSLDDLNRKIKEKVDFIIYEGEIKGKPSQIVDLTKEEAEIIKR